MVVVEMMQTDWVAHAEHIWVPNEMSSRLESRVHVVAVPAQSACEKQPVVVNFGALQVHCWRMVSHPNVLNSELNSVGQSPHDMRSPVPSCAQVLDGVHAYRLLTPSSRVCASAQHWDGYGENVWSFVEFGCATLCLTASQSISSKSCLLMHSTSSWNRSSMDFICRWSSSKLNIVQESGKSLRASSIFFDFSTASTMPHTSKATVATAKTLPTRPPIAPRLPTHFCAIILTPSRLPDAIPRVFLVSELTAFPKLSTTLSAPFSSETRRSPDLNGTSVCTVPRLMS